MVVMTICNCPSQVCSFCCNVLFKKHEIKCSVAPHPQSGPGPAITYICHEDRESARLFLPASQWPGASARLFLPASHQQLDQQSQPGPSQQQHRQLVSLPACLPVYLPANLSVCLSFLEVILGWQEHNIYSSPARGLAWHHLSPSEHTCSHNTQNNH